VQKHLHGQSRIEIISWLSSKGALEAKNIKGTEVFCFQSSAGLRACFFFDRNDLIFFGDHSTLTIRE
ncbi:MAG: hypothetical protein AAF889_05120, partial [Cyanobacteria bacterium P01_D01_bin.73]